MNLEGIEKSGINTVDEDLEEISEHENEIEIENPAESIIYNNYIVRFRFIRLLVSILKIISKIN